MLCFGVLIASPLSAKEFKAPTLRIAAVGDIMLGNNFPINALPKDDGRSLLKDIAHHIRSADLAFGNLEGVLIDGGIPLKECHNKKACYLFRSPERYANILADAGFDLLSLANNHALDFGEDGRSATMQALDRAGIYHSGRKGLFASLNSNGMKVAMLAYSTNIKSNSIFDLHQAKSDVRTHNETHDIVIVSFHAGAEGAKRMNLPFKEETFLGENRGDVVRFARAMVDAGADLVLGHGPHVVRAIENYKERLIAYSLGNFATYYGINVKGVNGVAPILLATLDSEGRFIEGELISTKQIRPTGTTIDKQNRALRLVEQLTNQDFKKNRLIFDADGKISPHRQDNLASN